MQIKKDISNKILADRYVYWTRHTRVAGGDRLSEMCNHRGIMRACVETSYPRRDMIGTVS